MAAVITAAETVNKLPMSPWAFGGIVLAVFVVLLLLVLQFDRSDRDTNDRND